MAAVGSTENTDQSDQGSSLSAGGDPGGSQVSGDALDDAAGLLLSIDLTDRGALVELRDMLGEAAGCEALNGIARVYAAEARHIVSKLIQGEAPDHAAALEQATVAVERAIKAQDGRPIIEQPGDAAPEQTASPGEGTARPKHDVPDVEEIVKSLSDAQLPDDTDAELLGEYIAECLGHIEAAEEALLALETTLGDSAQINTVSRSFHTIKGTSGFLGLEAIQKLAHMAESLLNRARDGEIQLKGGYADLALESTDSLKALIEGLSGLSAGDQIPVPENCAELIRNLSDPEGAGIGEEEGERASPRVGDILVAEGKVQRERMEAVASEEGSGPIGTKLVSSGVASAPDVAKALRTQKQLGGGKAGDAVIRVSTGRMDRLIDMAGELVIAHSMVAQDPVLLDDDGIPTQHGKNVSHMGKIVRELQDLTMALRMVPLKATFQKVARLLRDLGRKTGKSVQLEASGEDTEIDRNMVEMLNDPLVHMIRNAVDHGIESVEDRRTAGKPETGTVRLEAYHASGTVVIELRDDGGGLDRERIVAKAVERGVVAPGRELSDEEAYSLIFEPGFSTADEVSDVSGRGVGMDVVKQAISALRGRIEVASTLGRGTTFTIRLPLTMAIADAMLLRVGEQRYLIPTVAIEQSFRPEPGAVTVAANLGEIVRLRSAILPVFRLHAIYGIDGAVEDPCQALLMVIGSQGTRFALLVDELLEQQQIVIKPLGEAFGGVLGIAGGAILGDGRVGLVLDPVGLLQLARGDAFAGSGEGG